MTRNGHHRHRTLGFGGKRTLLGIGIAQLALTLVLIGTLAAASIFDIRGNASQSAPCGIYRLTHEPLIRGAYVVLKLPLKQIAALPGDTVRVTPEGSYVNSELWPHSAIPTDAPNHFPFGTYLLHPNQLWVLGDNPLSYDSRYFGMIPESLVNATAKPFLITENNHDLPRTPSRFARYEYRAWLAEKYGMHARLYRSCLSGESRGCRESERRG